MSDGSDSRPRLCHVIKWPDFDGYGFNLHAERGKAGQYIGKVDDGSPAEKAGLKEGDRIVEINGTNIGNENHQQVVGRIRAGGDEVQLLVVDTECDRFYKENKQVVRGDLPEVLKLNSNRDEPRPSSEESAPVEPSNDQDIQQEDVQVDIQVTPPEPEPEPEPERIDFEAEEEGDQDKNVGDYENVPDINQVVSQVPDVVVDQSENEVEEQAEIHEVQFTPEPEMLPEPEAEPETLPEPEAEPEPEPEPEVEEVINHVEEATIEDMSSQYYPRHCHITKWPDFQGYGFNLHAERDHTGQYIGKIDEGSPAEEAGLREGDRIIEINGTNIENETHQQAIARVKAGGDETKMLVVDKETDMYYKNKDIQISSSLPEVKFIANQPRGGSVDNGPTEPEPEPVPSYISPPVEPEPVQVNSQEEEDNSQYYPRLCHVIKWPDFQGYGFNLHAEKDKPGQYIGKIDEDSPAEAAGMLMGDRIIEVNGVNIEQETHQQVIARVKAGGDETKMLVVDKETDQYYQRKGVSLSSSMPEVKAITTPRRGAVNGSASTAPVSAPVSYSAPAASPTSSAANGDLNLNLTAAEMRAQLSSKKGGKHHVKAKGMDFKSKYEMFQRM